MKKTIQLFIILFIIFSNIHGATVRIDHFPTYQEYYCFEEFTEPMPTYGLYVDGCQYHDKVSVYILDKSTLEYVLRDEYLCPTTTTYGKTYLYLTSNIYQDYLKYGNQLEYKTVIVDNYGTGSTFTTSFIIYIDKYIENVVGGSITQTCNSLSIDATRVYGNVTRQWYYSSTEAGEYTYLTNTSSYDAAQTGYYKLRLKPERCNRRTLDKYIEVSSVYLNNLSGGSIANSAAAPVCDNVSLPITEIATATGGSSKSYVWYDSDDQSNWTNMYLTSNIVTVIPRNVKSFVKRTVSSCNGNLNAESNIIQISEIPELISGGQINGDQTICYGTAPGKLTGSAATGGGTVIYTWQSSEDGYNWSDISGTNQLDYSPGALTKTTYFHRVANSTCGTKTSNTVTVTVYASLSFGTIASDQTICFKGTPNNIAGSTPSGGYSDYTYTWLYSLDNTNWLSANNTIRDLQPSLLQKTTLYKRLVTDNCGSGYSNTVTITVNEELSSVSITGDQSVCYGASISSLVGEYPTGAGGTYTFKWQKSTDNKNWFDITNSNSKDYQPVNITQTTYFRRTTSTNLCGMATSNVVKIMVSPELKEGTITGNQKICEGAKPTDLIGLAVDGVTYQWQNSPNGDLWENIAGANTQNYSPVEISISKYFRRGVISGCGDKYSNRIYITVHPKPLQPSVVGVKSFYCKGNNVSISAVGDLYNYEWYDNSGLILSLGKKFEINNVTGNQIINVRSIDVNNCKSDPQTLDIKVDNITAGFIADKTTIEKGEMVKFTDNSANASSYAWTFSEGEKATAKNPAKYFYNVGMVTVKQMVQSAQGCKDSIVKKDYITVGSTIIGEVSNNVTVTIYPNPTTNILNIDFTNEEVKTIILFNDLGKAVFEKTITDLELKLDISPLPVGLYIIQVNSKSNCFTSKIVKQ